MIINITNILEFTIKIAILTFHVSQETADSSHQFVNFFSLNPELILLPIKNEDSVKH